MQYALEKMDFVDALSHSTFFDFFFHQPLNCGYPKLDNWSLEKVNGIFFYSSAIQLWRASGSCSWPTGEEPMCSFTVVAHPPQSSNVLCMLRWSFAYHRCMCFQTAWTNLAFPLCPLCCVWNSQEVNSFWNTQSILSFTNSHVTIKVTDIKLFLRSNVICEHYLRYFCFGWLLHDWLLNRLLGFFLMNALKKNRLFAGPHFS